MLKREKGGNRGVVEGDEVQHTHTHTPRDKKCSRKHEVREVLLVDPVGKNTLHES